jgi:tetratricopeptide (TPR) repeat protein
MKKVALISFVAVVLLASCKDSKKETIAESAKDDVILQEEEVVDDLPNPSDLSFTDALAEYEKGNYDKAADYIEYGVIRLREEEKPTEGVTGILLDMEIQNLRSIEDNVRENKIKDIDVLTQSMANAEMLLAHDYVIYTVASLGDAPPKSGYYYDKALRSLDKALSKLNGDAKKEAQQIREESKKIEDKVKSGSKDSEKDLKKMTQRIEDFLKKNKI